MLEKTMRMNELLDYYAPLLTQDQRTVCEQYFKRDLSLSEISTQRSTSRQAVHDLIERARKNLEEYESKLGLIDRNRKRQKGINELRDWLIQNDAPGTVLSSLDKIEQPLESR